APFAFLGSAYDSTLTDIYTSGVASTLVQSPSVTNIVFGSGLFGDGRLRDLVRRYVTSDLLAAIAEQHAKGRRLLVVTTNLDSQRAVIWNMGAIATNGGPNAVALFTDVLTASASIPAVFPPQLLDVQAEGRAFQEMHVDGSVVTPVFTLPQSFLLRDGRLRTAGKADIYVIINGRLEPEFDVAQNN
ncbi:alpha/beta hydrolase, partial [Methylobacterium bullatum]|nr:alpha/beta hydrolase [Methylobacterium bullatum]